MSRNNSSAKRTPSVASDYYNILKPRITLLVLITMVAGSILAADGPLDWIIVLHALIGTALASGGTAALNQYMERDVDAHMRRTENRALVISYTGHPRVTRKDTKGRRYQCAD